MSRGRWNYENENFANELFSRCYPCFGIDTERAEEYRKIARKENPFQDKQFTELVYDVLAVIYSADNYLSCDTSEESYRRDLTAFKKKWLDGRKNLTRDEVDKSIAELREELHKEFDYE